MNWNRLLWPLLGPQIFFRLQRAQNITRSQEMYINWNCLPRPLLGLQIFFRLRRAKLRRAKNITRFLEMYINWNRLPRPLLGLQTFFPPAAGWKHNTPSRNLYHLEPHNTVILGPQIFSACGGLKTYHALKKCISTETVHKRSQKKKKQYGLRDAGAGFWLQKNFDSKKIWLQKNWLQKIIDSKT